MEMSFGGLNLHKADLKITAGLTKQLIKEGIPQVAFVGRSNVGKSSLMNSLLGRKKLARVSSEPGKTITVNYYNVDDKLYLVDLPGYGYAKRSMDSKRSWSSLTEDYFVKNPSSDALKLVIQLMDIRTGPSDDDIMMINMMIDRRIPFILVATKTDKLSKTALANRIDELHKEFFEGTGIEIIPFSSVTREGKDEVWKKIIDAIS